MKSVVKVVLLMLLVIILCLTGITILNMIGITEGGVTKLVPFGSMIIGVLIFIRFVDKDHIRNIGLFYDKKVIKNSLLLGMLALIPLVVGIVRGGEVLTTKQVDITILWTILYYFLVGFTEELLYRGYIYNKVTINKLKMLISSLAFAGFHLISPEFNLILFLLLFVFGLLKVSMYRMIKNLWPLIVFHMIWDIGAHYTNCYDNALLDLVILVVILLIIYLRTKMSSDKERAVNI